MLLLVSVIVNTMFMVAVPLSVIRVSQCLVQSGIEPTFDKPSFLFLVELGRGAYSGWGVSGHKFLPGSVEYDSLEPDLLYLTTCQVAIQLLLSGDVETNWGLSQGLPDLIDQEMTG